MSRAQKEWDVFISHASEDRDSFVQPFAEALRNLGVSVWYAEFSLHIGDSLSTSIDKGLAASRFGIVVISPHFIQKQWTKYELRGLVNREIEEEDRVILPIWHGVTKEQVLNFSPPLADKFAIETDRMEAQDVAIRILRQVRPDLYAQHPRSHLEQLASGEALRVLQEEIERTREELKAARQDLSEYRCPSCAAALSIRIDAPADPEQKHWDVRECFECGFQRFGGSVEQPCPADPQFPKFEDYELHFEHSPEDSHFKWRCFALGRTDMARRLNLVAGFGETKQEAELRVREHYNRYARIRPAQLRGPRG
ncbi:MAG: toll/interleukin-1 receptor domain-containing protein [Candidatus Binatia bacterium]|jgi:hypothetical protein